MERVLIAGCGDVGTAIGRRLAAAGVEVFGLRRHVDALPNGIVPVAADLTDPGSLRGLPDGLDAVVVAVAADERTEAGYRSTYVDGLSHLLGALAGRGAGGGLPARLLLVSSTAVYGQSDGAWVDEDTPTAPTRFTGRVMLDAEALVAQAGTRGIVLRCAGIYGPGRTRLLRQVRDGEASCHEVTAYTNRIHRDDAAGAAAHLLTLDDPEPVYLAADDDPAPRCEVLRWLADRLGAPDPPVEPGASSRGANKRCRNDRLRASGYTLAYPTFREGYEDVLRTAS